MTIFPFLKRVAAAWCLTGSIAASAASPPAKVTLLYSQKSLYQNINVFQGDGQICMSFRVKPGGHNQLLQSCQLLADPAHHALDYTQLMLGALYLQPNPRRILIIGLGGGIVPTTLQTLYPNAGIDVVEVDPAVEKVARGFFNWRPGGRTRVTIEDGRVFVKRAARRTDRYDIVMIDAFNSDYIPEHLLTREFLAEVRQVLAPGGVVVANTFSQGGLYAPESVTYRAAFGPFFNVRKTNRVIIARPDGLPTPQQLAVSARRIAAALRPYVDDPWDIYRRLDRRVDWNPQARVLSDDYSPANLLNARK